MGSALQGQWQPSMARLHVFPAAVFGTLRGHFSRIDAVQEMILPLKRYAQFEGVPTVVSTGCSSCSC